jgi:hypothetical protein
LILLFLVFDALRDTGDHRNRDNAATEKDAEWKRHGIETMIGVRRLRRKAWMGLNA